VKLALAELAALINPTALATDAATLEAYGFDATRTRGEVLAVVWPATTAEVAALVQWARRYHTPIIPRGRGTGMTGGSVPMTPSVVLSLERMTAIHSLDLSNRSVRVGPGAVNGDLQQFLAPHGFFWPTDPSSSFYCSIGGNIAEGTGGPKAVKYGVTKDWVLGLTAVTGSGEVIHTGAGTSKSVTGYDLTRLLVGSEGTLAIVTEAILKIAPQPQTKATIRAIYRGVKEAAEAVAAIMSSHITPSALEFIDAASCRAIETFNPVGLPDGAGGMLMIEVEGSVEGVATEAAEVERLAAVEGVISLRRAQNAAEAASLWKSRKALSPALLRINPQKINEDIVVPVGRLPELVQWLEGQSKEQNIPIANFGHAGNGNIHVNLMVDPADTAMMARAEPLLDTLFHKVIEMGGSLSGEHGIGTMKSAWLGLEVDPATLATMQGVRKVFDPDGILNPGKIFPA